MNFNNLKNEELIENYEDIEEFLNYIEKEIKSCDENVLKEDK